LNINKKDQIIIKIKKEEEVKFEYKRNCSEIEGNNKKEINKYE
jgi:hypothetical protein